MKHVLLLLTVAFVACSNPTTKDKGKLSTSLINIPISANGVDTVAVANKPTMEFTDTVYDFGNMHENEVVMHEFKFTNTGKTPLIINNASGSCGCTVPEYPKDPVPPNATAVLKVTFNSSGKKGHQEKSVTIRTNTYRNIHMLYIKGEVMAEK